MINIINPKGIFYCLVTVCVAFLTGCASIKPLPQAYLNPKHDIFVKIVKCPEKPQMMDSGQGGILGAIITGTSRKSTMKQMMAGIQGETVKELVRQEMNRAIQQQFNIVDSDTDLTLNITINNFGFFVPTTVAGIKTGAYQFQIAGTVEIVDSKLKSKRVASAIAIAQSPLGSKPSAEAVPDALTQSVKIFVENTVKALLMIKEPSRTKKA